MVHHRFFRAIFCGEWTLAHIVFFHPTRTDFLLPIVIVPSSQRQSCDLDELVKHALKALSGCVTGDKELDAQGLTLAIVGKVGKLAGSRFTMPSGNLSLAARGCLSAARRICVARPICFQTILGSVLHSHGQEERLQVSIAVCPRGALAWCVTRVRLNGRDMLSPASRSTAGDGAL